MSKDNTLAVSGLAIGGLTGGVVGAIIGGIIGSILQEIIYCPICGGIMKFINGLWRCSICGYAKTN